ncbi:39S ribosomal protein L21, mitochondrial isoform X3 [Zalophus californianus]|uniref:Large ribosomal subunit protein bL21m n=1 Tax=Zalophus californianus TaxID=9704 RepID=A0A6J2BT77_ZALCA|nr:39S ribosomal protein L21, mitochondrial isoform X3 [Zalophus californianus]
MAAECAPTLPGPSGHTVPPDPARPWRYVPKTSLSSPPWPEAVLPDPAEETRHHAEVVGKVNEMIAKGRYGRLFAVVHFASHQWKVTSEDLILIDNELDIACGERVRLEKVLLVGADDFTLLGKPLLGKDLVRVEATVIEKTESWPKINMKFQKRKNYKRKKACPVRHGRGHQRRLSRPAQRLDKERDVVGSSQQNVAQQHALSELALYTGTGTNLRF